MRSSACVVMATKAVAALLRNKMAGVVSLSLLLLLPPLSSFLFGISELEQIGCDTILPPLVPRLALSLCSLFCPSKHPFTLHTCESAGVCFEQKVPLWT